MAQRQQRSSQTQKKPSVVKDIIELNVNTVQYSKPNKCEVSSCDPLKRGTDRLDVTSRFPAETYSWIAFHCFELTIIKDMASKLKATACLFYVIQFSHN